MQEIAGPSSFPSSSDYDRCRKAVAASVADFSRSAVGMKPGRYIRHVQHFGILQFRVAVQL